MTSMPSAHRCRQGRQRLDAWMTLDGPGRADGWPFQVAVESTPTQAHACFIMVEPGRGPDNSIEELAEQFYQTSVAKPILGLFRRPEQFRRRDLAFYTYMPWRIHRQDTFSAVTFERITSAGFRAPSWRQFRTVPATLRDLADYRTSEQPHSLTRLPR